jgi:hypothetical protein
MSGDRCADCGRRETVCQHCSRDEIVKLRAEVEALRENYVPASRLDQAQADVLAAQKRIEGLEAAGRKLMRLAQHEYACSGDESCTCGLDVACLAMGRALALRSAPPGAP